MERLIELVDQDYQYCLDYATGKTNIMALNNAHRIIKAVADGTRYETRLKADMVAMLDKIRAEIMDCLKALDDIEKSGLNIYLPNEMTGRRLTYQQCLEFIDKYKAEIETQESEDKE